MRYHGDMVAILYKLSMIYLTIYDVVCTTLRLFKLYTSLVALRKLCTGPK